MEKPNALRRHNRQSIRLKEYDYTQPGYYFITINIRRSHCLFGKIESGKMIMNDAGKMIEAEWLKIPDRFPNTCLHNHIVMPNHFHSIIEILPPKELPEEVFPADIQSKRKIALGDIIGAFQSITTVEYIRGVKKIGWESFEKKLWQRNYWEHIIRNRESYLFISNYITKNPETWEKDRFFRGE